jgi:hypothetical protein
VSDSLYILKVEQRSFLDGLEEGRESRKGGEERRGEEERE